MDITNRQRKVLAFFGEKVFSRMSPGAIGWEIGQLFADPAKLDRWNRYVYLTDDVGAESPDLVPFGEAELAAVVLPDGWSALRALREHDAEIAAQVMAEAGPFDVPQPEVDFTFKNFVFTGGFCYGERSDCQEAVRERGGFADGKGSVSRTTDYLVIGSAGSPAWSHGNYGSKIERAIVLRRENGRPAIISEEHWAAALKA